MRSIHTVRSCKLLMAALLTCLFYQAESQDAPVSDSHITFIDYPDFPEANSTWGDIGYNAVYNTVYIGVTNHKNKIGFYEYSVADDAMKLKGFVSDLAHLRDFQWQGKIHTKIVCDPEGNVYFGTDGGESREEYLMNHPHGYSGGFLMKWDPKEERLTNLGVPMQYESIKDVDIDPETGKIYAISYPQVHFITLDPETNELQDFGRLGSAHVPRVIFTDRWGNCYYVDWRQRLVKFEKNQGKLVFAKESLPAFPGTPGIHIITGITAYAKDTENDIIYFVTYGAKMLALHTQQTGIGKVEDLGAAFDTDDIPLWKPYIPNLNLGDNNKLYYFIGGHGNYAKEGKTLLMELDPATREKSIVFEYPTTEISEVTGSDIKDKAGNLYFAGRRIRPIDKDTPASLPSINDNVSIPFMIKFNPQKAVR